MAYVIDVQGFRSSSSEFVFKEVATLSTEKGAQLRVFLSKLPHGWNQLPSKLKSENRWLEENYLGIFWSGGDIPYEELEATLQDALKNSTRVFVKGGEKKRLLDKIIPEVLRKNDESVEHAPLEPEDEGLVDSPPLNNEVIKAIMPNDPHLIDAIRVFQIRVFNNSIEEEELLSMALNWAEVEWEPPSKRSC
ncbi:hypothetical protein QAD02_002840 [Eretmocerus hayati]|uniref:Uncharacterized protein n=1 Tax=Eretmocerus hayati TaxID=131215 RepID=A0ACC2NL03_9HYME|nr:hypothetical protein QAD02_002840 [Eretmocerus hayati]